jgi:hypothetical protein
VHGEPAARESLAGELRSLSGWNLVLPEEGESVELK